jgi:hypothetical protein
MLVFHVYVERPPSRRTSKKFGTLGDLIDFISSSKFLADR